MLLIQKSFPCRAFKQTQMQKTSNLWQVVCNKMYTYSVCCHLNVRKMYTGDKLISRKCEYQWNPIGYEHSSKPLFYIHFKDLLFFPYSIWKPNVCFADMILQMLLELKYNFNILFAISKCNVLYKRSHCIFSPVAFSNPYLHRQILAEVLEQTRKQLIWLKTNSY